jgi:farnesyl diphosphate synthase
MGRVGQNLVSELDARRNCSDLHPWLWKIGTFARTMSISAQRDAPDARTAGKIVTLASEVAPSFSQRLRAAADETDHLLDRLLASTLCEDEILRPKRLLEAIRYATLGGGKRIRPFLVVESAALFDAPRAGALMVGAALECVHCYSLVHDDLPAMDNDDLRRGQPTVHKAFDEATAILVGDSLLTFAFDVLSRPETHPDADARVELVSALARASGLGGMAGGQMLDLAAEGRFEPRREPLDLAAITTLQEMKTGALLRFACVSGAILAKARPEERAALARYGDAIGRAFQIADDLLDVEGDAATVGKSTGKDAAAGKATFVGVLGAEGARAWLRNLVAEAESALAGFGARASVLSAAARFIAERRA